MNDENRIRAAAASVVAAAHIDLWMDSAPPRLDGRSPLEAIADGDAERVLAVIEALADGVFS